MQMTMLIGNGPNRLSETTVSWENVLEQLMINTSRRTRKNAAGKPLPLLFDELALDLERRGTGGPGELRRAYAQAMQALSPNSVHHRIMELGLRHILTTNYDYALELAAAAPDPESRKVRSTGESKFSLFRYRSTATSQVWHLHGEIDYPRTLQLGYEHYGSCLGRMQRYVTDGGDGQVSPFVRGKVDFEAKPLTFSWIDVFLRDDVHILGLGLDFVEIDLWWLLVYKERLRCRRRLPVGATVYHHFYIADLSARDRARLSTLEGLGVKVVSNEIDGEWAFARAYHDVISEIRYLDRRARNKRT